jgi:hypothetical protein
MNKQLARRDLWSPEDDSLFLKYCPNPRDRCYHAMSRDSAARPHELLRLRIKDVVFKLTPDKKQYAEILVNSKTGTRHIPLIDSIAYIKTGYHNIPKAALRLSILLNETSGLNLKELLKPNHALGINSLFMAS